jgi:hypothetical protein
MNTAFREVIAADDDARRDLFLTTAGRLGTAVQNVEKGFWVCWTLDALFNGLPAGTPRLLFKGGMLDALERDYNALAVMIMGAVPPLADVMDAVSALEDRLNAGA